jgi:transaldolase
MNKIILNEVADFGQSIWLDNITRSMIEEGRLENLVDLGLRGMTSNPTIFDKAVAASDVYNKQISDLSSNNMRTFNIYDEITVKDVQDAADIFRSVYEKTRGLDGYVSLEINPKLAYNVKQTIEEGKRLHAKVARPNVMFKVPSTEEGFKAIEELTALGINVNITLIFSLNQYQSTASSYMKGIKRLIDSGKSPEDVHSVASVFVSRVDTAVDKKLEEKEAVRSLRGKAAVANAKTIYKEFIDTVSSDQFKQLQDKGANIQRLLWGSTSTKNPAYSDIKYVTELMGKNTVNTVPDRTLEAFLDHGKAEEALTENTEDAPDIIKSLKQLDIDIDQVCRKLLKDGVLAFEESFESLLKTIEKRSKQLCKDRTKSL